MSGLSEENEIGEGQILSAEPLGLKRKTSVLLLASKFQNLSDSTTQPAPLPLIQHLARTSSTRIMSEVTKFENLSAATAATPSSPISSPRPPEGDLPEEALAPQRAIRVSSVRVKEEAKKFDMLTTQTPEIRPADSRKTPTKEEGLGVAGSEPLVTSVSVVQEARKFEELLGEKAEKVEEKESVVLEAHKNVKEEARRFQEGEVEKEMEEERVKMRLEESERREVDPVVSPTYVPVKWSTSGSTHPKANIISVVCYPHQIGIMDEKKDMSKGEVSAVELEQLQNQKVEGLGEEGVSPKVVENHLEGQDKAEKEEEQEDVEEQQQEEKLENVQKEEEKKDREGDSEEKLENVQKEEEKKEREGDCEEDSEEKLENIQKEEEKQDREGDNEENAVEEEQEKEQEKKSLVEKRVTPDNEVIEDQTTAVENEGAKEIAKSVQQENDKKHEKENIEKKPKRPYENTTKKDKFLPSEITPNQLPEPEPKKKDSTNPVAKQYQPSNTPINKEPISTTPQIEAKEEMVLSQKKVQSFKVVSSSSQNTQNSLSKEDTKPDPIPKHKAVGTEASSKNTYLLLFLLVAMIGFLINQYIL